MRLVDADEAEKYLYEHLDDLHMIAAQNAIDEMPTIDAQPVKRGKWEQDASGELYCPYCMYVPQWDDDKFCAHCGAEMCGGDADDGQGKSD